MPRLDTEVLIIGAGIVGLTLARELVQRGADRITIIEKEDRPGRHASGRNSGVLHAGIYYTPDSMKARSCLRGNRLMRAYCREKGLPLLETGKVIVASRREDLPVLDQLLKRALANGAAAEMIDEKTLARLEPNARTVERAIYSPETAVVDPQKILASLRQDLESSGRVSFRFNCRFLDAAGSRAVRTSRGGIGFQRLVNAAGAHSDRVAQAFGAGMRYRLIPFKGIYFKLRPESAGQVAGSIYPVPDIRNPFLGVHFTRNVYGDVYLGPTAIPAFGRENYGLLEGIDREAPRILAYDADLFCTNPQFRQVALTEWRKYLFPWFFRDAARLVKRLDPREVVPSPKAGIRPQLVDWQTRELVQDFTLEAAGAALHILNPVSPAFTGSLDLARTLADTYF